MRLVEGNSKRTWQIDCPVWEKAHGLRLLQPEGGASSSDDGSSAEPPVEILVCRGGAGSQEIRERIAATDEGCPHPGSHRRYRDRARALGSHEDRINSE